MTWTLLRAKRNQLLEQTDKFMLSDFPLDTSQRTKYKEYRQYLRNLPKMYNDESIKVAKVKNFEQWLDFRRNGTY